MGIAVRATGILISLAGIAYADIDFTPRIQEYDLDGVKLRQVVFLDGNRTVTYSPPRKWDFSGTRNRFVLHPTFGAAAEAIITTTKLPRSEAFDESTTKSLCDEVLASVPRDATNIALVSQQLNPLMIERKPTFLAVITYDYNGQPYERSVLFLNRQSEQVRFQLTCSRSEFATLQKAFQTSHFSWQNL